MNKLYVFLPCYNEELNIGILIDEWMEQSDELRDNGYELIVCPIDDCSKDNTQQVMKDSAAKYGADKVNVIVHEVNKNLRGGLNTSISAFLSIGNEGDLMCLMDGDATHSPKYVHSMLAKMKSAGKDCIIASRYCPGSDVVGLKGYRKFLSDMAKIYYSIVLRVPGVKDYTFGYRLYNLECIKRLKEAFGEDPIKEMSFACMMEFLYKLHLSGTTFDEVGFELRYDKKQGDSKMRVSSTIKNSLFSALRFRKLKKQIKKA
jgi:dolichol-phosphate mannosyltransferase